LPFALPGAAAWLRRSSLPLAAASALALSALALPAGARAADNLASGGVVGSGSALAVGVSGAPGTDGAVEARFSAVDSPLFWGADTTNMNDHTAAYFALNTPTGLYSPQPYTTDNQPFTQLSAPVQTGMGTVGDPYVITSQFRATAAVDITQTVTHVSGTTRFLASWAIHNGSGSTTAMQAFEGADMYVNENDNGNGTASGTQPNRQIGSVASDGTTGSLVEQPTAPWTHYFSGMNSPFYDSTSDSTFGSLPDTIDPTNQDSGMAVQWDFNLAAGATKTVAVQWSFTAPAAPQAPVVTTVPAGTVNTTSAAPHFAPAPGDTQVVGYECSVDGGAFTTCASPASVSGLADGVHTYDVRATNSAGLAGAATTKTWTVDTTPPVAPSVTGAPAGTVANDAATLTLGGEAGATFTCSVDGGAFVTCTSPLSLTGLADGHHAVAVKQVDAAHNAGTLASTAGWTVDTSVPAAPPAEVDAPAGTTATTATVDFTTPAGHTAECSLDDAGWEACAAPVAVAGLRVGTHTMRVRMVNAAGTPGAVKTVTWDVAASPATTDTTATTATTTTPAAAPAPVATTIVPAACVSRRSVTVHWKLPAGAKAPRGFAVLVDGKVARRLPAKARAFTLALAGRPAATVKVQVKALGTALATTRAYKTCAGRAGRADLATVVLKKG
jgi:hypothetical protein